MEVVSLDSASVRLAGKERIVEQETSKSINVCLDAQIMDIMTSRQVHACVIVIGLVTIVHKLFAA
jgi:hypothetical protein